MILTINDIIYGLLGGVFNGIAGAILYLFLGRLIGISHIFSEIFVKEDVSNNWRVALIVGLIFGGLIFRPFAQWDIDPLFPDYDDGLLAAIAGLLVGFGAIYTTRYLKHQGICGVVRLSKAGLIAIAIFLLSGIFTVTCLTLLHNWE